MDLAREYFELYLCSTCDNLSLFSGVHDSFEFQHYPTGVSLGESVPKRVSGYYYEAKALQKKSTAAFATRIRCALEALCADRGFATGPLHARLEQLQSSGQIPPILAEMTAVLRQLGNAGAHDSDQKFTPSDAIAIDDFFRAVIEFVYVAPGKLEAFKKALSKRSRKRTRRTR